MQASAIVIVLLMVVSRVTSASLSNRQEIDDEDRDIDWNSQDVEDAINDDSLRIDGTVYYNDLATGKKSPVTLASRSGDVYLTLLRPLPSKWRRGRPMFEIVPKEKLAVPSGIVRGTSSVNYASFEPFVEPIRMDNIEMFGERNGPFSGRRMLH